MKAFDLEVLSKDEMGFINGGGDVTVTKILSIQMVQQQSLRLRLRMMEQSWLTK